MMEAVPLELKVANEYVQILHRHHDPVHRDKYRVGALHNGKLVGVVQVGRPVSRMLDDGKTVEVVRLCTDGTKDVCSFLYSKAARIAKEMGYERIITYILCTESGTSLRACGWQEDGTTSGGHWSRPSRKRNTTAPTVPKKRYVKYLNRRATDECK
jgi:hypothetical protein